MSQTIHEVLGQLRASSLDARDQGDKFEALVAAFLRTDPEWTAKFDDVWTWTEWPGRAGRHDTGVDLVAKLRDSDKLAAIQCKFYGEGATVSKGAIDSFLSASSKTEFAARYIFDTAKSWSKNADDTLDGQLVPVQRVDLHHLDEANIDWSAYSWDTPEVLPSTGPKSLRPHQTKALQAVREGLTAGDRGKLIMACGTGKTFTSLRIAEDLVGVGGSVLFLVPSIQLLSQSFARVDGQPGGRHPAVRGVFGRTRGAQGLRRGRPLHGGSVRARNHGCGDVGGADGDGEVRNPADDGGVCDLSVDRRHSPGPGSGPTGF
ncbi:MAG: DEAD/DEAH box helicase family protein [Nocardioides sp.]